MIRLTRRQSRQIDRLAAEQYKIPSIVLMENAARSAAEAAGQMLGHHWDQPIVILCGGGNNGGDGLALARHLHNRGGRVTIALAVDPSRYDGDARVNWEIVRAMGLTVVPADADQLAHTTAGLMVDAVFGTGLTNPPRDPFAAIAAAVAASGVPVLAIDLPSGLDCDSGLPLGAVIRASRTITFVAEKAGFAVPESRAYTGQVIVGDIGCPVELAGQVAAGG